MKLIEFKEKIIIYEPIELIKFVCLVTMIKKYTLKDRYLEITIEIRQIQIEWKKKKEYRKLLL